ncbi:AAA family ATPase [Compostimonas suwonensis]|uniref:ATPase family protein associated with various cellular activities (AAA) n=1 Tax=Compostimonas suwonensis TaxID=1048394 RepID=A0A2M9C3T3_9MICO|nr:AAA family ATPase [Compostimonas suwonensis]PJJ65190.1 ATPase family protein associated with various cellular activities (AAA) [Compostimonas suwonensis]
MDDRDQGFVDTFRRFLEEVIRKQPVRESELTPLGELVQRHLGTDVATLPVVSEMIAQHRLVDADIALELLGGEDAQLVGVTGGQQRFQEDLPQLLSHAFVRFAPGPVDYTQADTGPDSSRQVVSLGVRLFHVDGAPVVVLQRSAQPRVGRNTASLEVLAADTATSGAVLADIRRLMLEHSVLRGQVLSFTADQFGHGAAGATFLQRPHVDAHTVVLSPGVLERVTDHVIEIGLQREKLRAAGQHLKRGILLYGPPGTGKTLTVRHLLSRTEGVTSILLAGSSIRFITEATELARAMQPAIVVLEDVDLVASERGMHNGPQPLLFAVLDALDGLDGDADVAFVLTTNRVDSLEPALAARPGRVDLALEIPLPDAEARRRLFALYSAGLPLSDEAVAAAADRSNGVTGSFAKELMRRTVLRAALDDREVVDSDLSESLDALLAGGEQLTRSLLGVAGDTPPPAPGGGTNFGGVAGIGWMSYD